MYQHWYVKQHLYKIDAIACERNGMGVPTIVMGAGAKKPDIDKALAWVQQLVTHERTGLVLPPEWVFKLVGVEGTLRDPKESIAHHNMQIAMAGLAMFMLLGSTDTGSRALGDTMADFFQLGLDATAKHIARTLNATTVKRLVDFNFSGVRHPRLVCQQILSVRFETIVDALQKLAQSKVIVPDDDLETWMREKVGAPAANPETGREVQPPQQPQLQQQPAAQVAEPKKLRAADTRRLARGVERCLRSERDHVGARSRPG